MSSEPLTRATLLLKIRDRHDQDAWRQFVDIYAPVVNQYAVRRGLQSQDAADVVQEVMRIISQSIDRFDYEPTQGRFRGWLHTLARNQIINYQKKNTRHRGSGDSDVRQLLNNQAEQSGETGELWEQTFQRQVFCVAIEQAKTEFSDLNWEAFFRTSVQQLPPAQVARELQMKVGTVYVAKSRVIARLREIVQEVGGEW